MVIFTKKFETLDPHLPIVWDKVPKKNGFLDTFPYLIFWLIENLKKYVLLKKVNFCQSCQIMDSRDASASKNISLHKEDKTSAR